MLSSIWVTKAGQSSNQRRIQFGETLTEGVPRGRWKVYFRTKAVGCKCYSAGTRQNDEEVVKNRQGTRLSTASTSMALRIATRCGRLYRTCSMLLNGLITCLRRIQSGILKLCVISGTNYCLSITVYSASINSFASLSSKEKTLYKSIPERSMISTYQMLV
jgi:hypothetical protein